MKKMSLFAGFLFLSGSFYWLGPHSAGDPFPAQREFQITYQARLPELPANAKSVRIWIPLASTREGQTILDRNIEAPIPAQVMRDQVYGNEIAYLEFHRPFPPRLDVKIHYRAQVSKHDPALLQALEDNGSIYLKPSQLMVVNDLVRERTERATRNKKTLAEKARAIYDDVLGKMKYDKTAPGWGRGDTVRACLFGKGNCTDFHSLFISMAHAAEIPERFKIGFTIPDGSEGEIPGYHCWAEFYEEGTGWRPVDASEAWKNPKRKEAYFGHFDTNKFLISVGRDIQLEPRQSGDPVNIFFYPYVEVDGKEWNGTKTSFEFKNLKA